MSTPNGGFRSDRVGPGFDGNAGFVGDGLVVELEEGARRRRALANRPRARRQPHESGVAVRAAYKTRATIVRYQPDAEVRLVLPTRDATMGR